jgi:hypothetical protein
MGLVGVVATGISLAASRGWLCLNAGLNFSLRLKLTYSPHG